MKRLIIIYFTFYTFLNHASCTLPSIFADRSIAQRVDRQRHLEQQIFDCKQEEPLVFSYLFQRISKKNSKDWQKLLQNFANSKTQKNRQEILKNMAAWLVANCQACKLRKNLDDFMEKQEKKIAWVMMCGIHVPDYQKRACRRIEKFRKFRVYNFDPYLKNK